MALGNKRQRQTRVLLRQVVLFGVAFLVDRHISRLVWLEFWRKFSSDFQTTDLKLLRHMQDGLRVVHLTFLVRLLEERADNGRVNWKMPTLLR